MDRHPSSRKRWLLRLLVILLLAALALSVLPVALLRVIPPPTTAYMLQSDTRPVRHQWVPRTAIAEHARRAVVASEDQKFWQHRGFDLDAIEKAQAHNRRSSRKRGASTISQQTAKNLFLWPGGGYFRKGVEAGYTVLIEALWPKERILEVYLNIAEFGPGIYGIEAAAQHFFGKPAARLTAREAALLAAVLPSPRRWRAQPAGPYVQQRAQWILGQMGVPSATPAPPEEVPEPEWIPDTPPPSLPEPTPETLPVPPEASDAQAPDESQIPHEE